jgi:hypothetical protein
MARYRLADESIRGRRRGSRWTFMWVLGSERDVIRTMRSVRGGAAAERRYGGFNPSVRLVALDETGQHVVAEQCEGCQDFAWLPQGTDLAVCGVCHTHVALWGGDFTLGAVGRARKRKEAG